MSSGYWYQRAGKSRQEQYSSSSLGPASRVKEEDIMVKDQESGAGYLERKSKQVWSIMHRVSKIEDYYQIICGEDYSNLALRCFDHNNEIILYCLNDHKLLCANCMFTLPNNIKPNNSNNNNNNNNNNNSIHTSSKHANHDVKQTQKATVEIANDVKTWQFELQQKASQLASCEMEWEKYSESFKKMKQKLLKELDKQYDKLQMYLSTQYMKTKKDICELSQPYEEHLEKITSSYKALKRLLIPHRYPIPAIKHSWLEYMRRLIAEMPTNFKDIGVSWLKSYEAQVRIFIRKFISARK